MTVFAPASQNQCRWGIYLVMSNLLAIFSFVLGFVISYCYVSSPDVAANLRLEEAERRIIDGMLTVICFVAIGYTLGTIGFGIWFGIATIYAVLCVWKRPPMNKGWQWAGLVLYGVNSVAAVLIVIGAIALMNSR